MGNINRGKNNGKDLLFNTKEERVRFILMYKDLFIPYKDTYSGMIFAKKNKDDAMIKQLKEGYCINPIFKQVEATDYIEGYELIINIEPDDWHYICKMLDLKRHNLPYRNYKYWSLN